jgi:protein gp37
MAQTSQIEWTDATWNPVTGCTKISPGCKHCYAERMAKRLQAMGQPRYQNGFDVTLQSDTLNQPFQWKMPRKIFVNSMSDLFHEQVPYSYISRIFDVMNNSSRHVFQILTKRSERLAELGHKLHWSSNIWIGVSVENQQYTYRIADLRGVPASVRFLSLEPLIGPINILSLRGIHWVIAGGESGPRSRSVKPEWIREIRDRCIHDQVPFFFKQWGGVRKSRTGRILDGKTWDQFPAPTPPA